MVRMAKILLREHWYQENFPEMSSWECREMAEKDTEYEEENT
jgi:hypothetical protein